MAPKRAQQQEVRRHGVISGVGFGCRFLGLGLVVENGLPKWVLPSLRCVLSSLKNGDANPIIWKLGSCSKFAQKDICCRSAHAVLEI